MSSNNSSKLHFLSDCTPVYHILGSPGKIGSFSGTPLNSSIKLDWSPPANSNEIPVDSYIIRYGKSNDPPDMINGYISTSITTITITKLLNGISYRFWISGVNRYGEGLLSEPQSYTPGSPPEPITLVRRGHHSTRNLNNDSLQYVGIEFVPPLNYNGYAPMRYIIRYYRTDGSGIDISESFSVDKTVQINSNNINGNELMVDRFGNDIYNTNGFMGNYVRREFSIPTDISAGNYRFSVYSENIYGISAVSSQSVDISLGTDIPRFIPPHWSDINSQIGDIYDIIPGDNKITLQFKQTDISGIGIGSKYRIQYTTDPNYWYYPSTNT